MPLRFALPVTCVGLLVLSAPAAAAGPPVGKRLHCYATVTDASSPTGYTSGLKATLTLSRKGSIRYQVAFGGTDHNIPQFRTSWRFAHGALHFRHGFFDGQGLGWHVAGRYYPSGVKMANAQLTPAKYTLVLHSVGAPADDTAPPAVAGAGALHESLWYCTTAHPVAQPHGGPQPGSSTPVPSGGSPSAGSNPAPADAPHPPYGHYSCNDKSGYYQDQFDLYATLMYRPNYSTEGSFTFDQSSGRIDFHGGKYDDSSIGQHLYGIYTSPATISLRALTQGTQGGPDADELGAHTYWTCTLTG